VIVEDIHDPYRLPISEGPGGRVDLPCVVGTGPLESAPRGVRALAWLRRHHPAPNKDTVNRGDRRNDLAAARELISNGLSTAIDT
jgi:hypothetical protein